MILPTLLLLAVVLMALATSLLISTTSGLRSATHEQQSDVAIYAAEAGLARVAEFYHRKGTLKGAPLQGEMEAAGSRYTVQLFQNPTATPLKIEGGLILPPSTTYFLATGISSNETRRQTGALFRTGLGAFQVGLLADTLRAQNSKFLAYDSTTNPDPSLSHQTDRGILASNRVDPNKGERQFQLTDTIVEGGVFTAPGTNPSEQIEKSGTTVVSREGSLADHVSLEKIEVPKVTKGDPVGGETTDSGTDVDPENYSPGPWRLTHGAPTELRVTYDADDGEFEFEDTGSDNEIGEISVEKLFELSEKKLLYKIEEDGHVVYLDFQSDPPKITYSDPNADDGYQASGNAPLPPIFTDLLNSSGPKVLNPNELGAGKYSSVSIEENTLTKLEEGVYVIENLYIEEEGQLQLPPGKKATIYVTNDFRASGTNALINDTKLPPNLKILYTGKNPVVLGGGSQSYLTLIAPHAPVQLSGLDPENPTTFYGALAGKILEIQNAVFHFDVATEGVGTGTDGSTFTLLSRQRI